ncbi:hypothetical protein [Sphingomonas sp. Mn802worker]|uniref:hypothetical protein n=1 Tax=Sphingomonas sp. Mn802worker TaxID=629773 RepID=UPI0003825E0F|nr:hypothetical protein [Sphingomonas sp. Mn802worker]
MLSRAVKPGSTDALHGWIKGMTDVAAAADGFAGAVRLKQSKALQHLLIRFGARASLEQFRESQGFGALQRRGAVLASGLDQVEDSNRVTIELPSDASASPWKGLVVTWLSVLPVLRLVSTPAREVLPFLAPPLQVVVSSIVLTALLQWLILPRVQRAARAWMLKNEAGKLRT